MSQENLAVDADVDRTSISGIEQQRFSASVDLLDRLAAALSVDISEFLLVPPSEQPEPQALPAGRKPKHR